MRHTTYMLLIACVVLAFQLASTEAQFSFSLPGKWGNGKRAAGAKLDCDEIDTENLFQIYRAATAEMTRAGQCLRRKLKLAEEPEH